MTKYVAIVVAYKPDNRLLDSLKVLKNVDLLDKIYLIDNTPKEDLNYSYQSGKIKYIPFNYNKGIAFAQNIGFKMAIKEGYEWALTLDQDTIIHDDLLDKYDYFINNTNNQNIAIINSDYKDLNTGELKYNNNSNIYVDDVISSGSIIKLSVLNYVGFMYEYFFIDQVDNEFCYRVKKSGLSIVILPGSGFEHRLGNIKNLKLGPIHISIYNQPPIRVFYRTRNIIIFSKKYKDYNLRFKNTIILLKDFIRLIFERKKLLKYKMFFKGVYQGFKWES